MDKRPYPNEKRDSFQEFSLSKGYPIVDGLEFARCR